MEDKNVLRVYHYGDTAEEDRRITLSPQNILAIAANPRDVTVQGRSLVSVVVLFALEDSMALTINHSDLELLEDTIGGFSFGD